MAKKILIIEDEKPLVEAISEFLKNIGYEPYIAYNGNEALEMLPKVLPDLILLDIVLPGMDGISVLKKIRAKESQFKDTSVVIFSNLTGEKKWVENMGLKITDYVVKANCSLKDLSVKIKNILG